MSTPIIIIDGLARSGTTLLSSLVHSQDSAACYRGVFHEFLACDVGRWKRDYGLYPMVDKKEQIAIVDRLPLLDQLLLKLKERTPDFMNVACRHQLKLSLSRLHEYTIRNIKRREQTDRLQLGQWEEICEFSNITGLDDLDVRYQELATLLDVKLLAFRWNQGFPYIDKFLRNPQHYWVSLVRHPLSRAYSDFKTFGESYELGVKYTKNFAQIVERCQHPNHHIVYFEELIINPEATLRSLFEKVGLKLPTVNMNLVQQSGASYRVESHDVKQQEKSHTEGREFKGFEVDKIKLPLEDIPKKFVQKLETLCSEYEVFEPYTRMALK